LPMQDRILNKARELMFQAGVKHVTMDDLATQLGISKKTIYQYFKDKDALVSSVVEFELANHALLCNQSTQAADNAVHEIFLLMSVIQEMFNRMNPLALFEIEKYYPLAFDKIKKHKEDIIFSMISANLEKGIAEGLYRKDVDITILSKYRLETSLIPFNIHVFHPSKFDLLKVNLQIIEHFVYGVATLEGHKLMDAYKLSNHTK
ncbi:MAG: TetR/AcrR family transcriptional regulator, partial [Chitinophagaceae bacterium]|nr:TetR/AcrR family transcriptional regulator [Chitinophagaceae bacterium]